jgi:hypothetical protein
MLAMGLSQNPLTGHAPLKIMRAPVLAALGQAKMASY